MAKRAFDIVVGSLLLLLTTPFLVLIALALKLQAQTPVWNLSVRLGKGGRVFQLVRFRTMRDGPLSEKDRLTPVGAFIRNISFDDVPNFINVVRGDMSLIGPRPMEPERVNLADDEWRRILTVRPDWNSYAVLMLAKDYNGCDPAFKRQLELDYVERQSLRFDLRLLADAFRSWFISRGNVKVRGKSRVNR